MEYTYQITCTIVVNKPKMLREVSNECYGNVLSGQLRSDDNFKFTKCYAVV